MASPFSNSVAALPPRFTVAYHIRALTGGVLIAGIHGLVDRAFIDGQAVTGNQLITPAEGLNHVCLQGRRYPEGYTYRILQALMPASSQALLAIPADMFGQIEIDPKR